MKTAASTKTEMLRAMMTKSATLPTAVAAFTAPTAEDIMAVQDASTGIPMKEAFDTAPATSAPAKEKKEKKPGRPFGEREVRSMRRASKLLNGSINRLKKLARGCNVEAQVVIAQIQTQLLQVANVADDQALGLIALRATDYKRADGEKVPAAKKGIEAGAKVFIRAKVAADFAGIATPSDALTVVRVQGSNVVVTLDGSTLVIARRMLTTSFDGEPKDPITASA